MKLNLSFLKLKKETSFHKKSTHLSPSFYWIVVFCSSVLLTFVFIILGNFMFNDLSQEQPVNIKEGSKSSLIIKKERIDKVLNYFKEKEVKSEDIVHSPIPLIDPSL